MSEKSITQALAAVMASVSHVAKRDINQHQRGRHYFPKGTPFWAKALMPSVASCWEWQAAVGSHGYGVVTGGKLAHRVAYELVVGPIQAGMTIDHLCLNRRCVNPSHMEVVTRAENSRRGEKNRTTRSGRSRPDLTSRTHCKNGHEFSQENTSLVGTARICRQCRRDRSRKFYAKEGSNA